MPLANLQRVPKWMPRAVAAAVAVLATSAMWTSVAATAEPVRPDLQTSKPQATCKLLQLPPEPEVPAMDSVAAFNYVPQASSDRLASYQRTALGDWQMASRVDRDDPWLRFVLLAHDRPIVIDVAVFVGGKPYSDAREAWIDDVLQPSTPQDIEDVAAKTVEVASEVAEKAVEKVKRIAPAATDDSKVAVESRSAPDMRARVNAYLATSGAAADRAEIRWLIAEWGLGPPVVLLDQSRSWQRAAVAPLWACLDADRSGSLEAAEIAAAESVLQKADANGDALVDVAELDRKASGPPVLPFMADHPLLVMIDDATDRDALAATCTRLYGLTTEKLEELLCGPATATFRVKFADKQPPDDAVAIYADATSTAGPNALTLDLGAETIEFTAASTQYKNEAAYAAATQIAVGAAVDGNPLLRLADGDHNGRLTLRERQQLPKLLASLDRNDDGAVAGAELSIPIRLAVTLGPQAHRLLEQESRGTRAVPAAAGADEKSPPATAPDWFRSMDSNADGDLARSEFLGTAEQFAQFDADGDSLLSVEEAVKMTPGQ